MIIRVPLILQPVIAVIHRLDVKGTRQHDPEGVATSGYDEVLQEPITYNTPTGTKVDSRREFAPIKVPCQLENLTDEQLDQMITGDTPVSNMVLVFHRADLERLGLLDSNRNTIIKKGDRVEHLERANGAAGAVVKKFTAPG